MSDSDSFLKLCFPEQVDRIRSFILGQARILRKKGIVIGLSGGVDSALCAELCLRALGRDRILGLILPEKESQPESRSLALQQAEKMGIPCQEIDITPVLDAFGTYEKRDRFVREVFSDFNGEDRMNIVLPPDISSDPSLNFYSLQVENKSGVRRSARLQKHQLKGITAAMATKQRTRMMTLYHEAEKRDYLVCGTTNRNETVLGFFVKFGDGGVDIEPIAHLYKSQVFALAEYVGVLPAIILRTPTPDTYSLEVSDEEFYFRLPYNILDRLLHAWEARLSSASVAEAMGLDPSGVERAFRDFAIKHEATRSFRETAPSIDL